MPLWGKRKPARRAEAEQPVVQVQFRELHEPIKEGRRGYAYRWPLVEDPKVGDRVFVDAEEFDDEPAVVVGFGRGGYGGELKEVKRFATAKEIARSELPRCTEGPQRQYARA